MTILISFNNFATITLNNSVDPSALLLEMTIQGMQLFSHLEFRS